eukprot:TRINITY_DN1108_c0_g1_i1.p1 TRINITY_DN1108_c0_g1~~TRINITY_DN1108_c0_g1_i1.p1  ORF type:complete len:184 (-),score=105.50 TRINITY_DN1108_c0_g1_i1:176-727(-)
MIRHFIDDRATEQINLPADMRRQIEAEAIDGDAHAFDAAQSEIFELMERDLWVRFRSESGDSAASPAATPLSMSKASVASATSLSPSVSPRSDREHTDDDDGGGVDTDDGGGGGGKKTRARKIKKKPRESNGTARVKKTKKKFSEITIPPTLFRADDQPTRMRTKSSSVLIQRKTEQASFVSL